jgi:hypothetical protein
MNLTNVLKRYVAWGKRRPPGFWRAFLANLFTFGLLYYALSLIFDEHPLNQAALRCILPTILVTAIFTALCFLVVPLLKRGHDKPH